MDTKSRTYNSIVNSIFGIISSAINVVLNFFVRVVLVHELGEEINGLNTLFYSVTNVLLLMELGIGTAMIIHLYEPLKNNNQQETLSILGFYRHLYRIVAIVFLIVGILLDLFVLDRLITSNISITIIRIYFLLFIFSYVVNYLTFYKRSILFADQKNRVSAIVSSFCEIAFRSSQIAIILLFHNYYLFLILAIFEKLTCNVICSRYVNKYYPYLKVSKFPVISTVKKNAIFNTIKPLMVSQVANSVQQSSQSILISSLLGNISIVGFFGNYNLLIGMAQLVFGQFGGAFTSSFGHLAVEKDYQRMKSAYFNSAFLLNWITCIFTVGFYCCSNDFIDLVFGKDSVLGASSVFVISINMLVYLINIPIISIQNAMGLHKLDAKYMVVQAILAIILGFVGGKYCGMPGIFIGLIIPLIIFSTLRKGMVIGKKALKLSPNKYLLFIGKHILTIISTALVCKYLCDILFSNVSILILLSKVLISLALGIILPTIVYFRTSEFKYVYSLMSKIFNKI